MRINQVMRQGMRFPIYRPITSGVPRSCKISTRGRENSHAQRNFLFDEWSDAENLYIMQFNLHFTCLLFAVNGILVGKVSCHFYYMYM